MDVAADSMRLHLAARHGIDVGDAVDAAIGHDGSEETVLTGEVVGVRPTIAGVEIWALGSGHGLLELHTSATFESQSVGAIARALIAKAGLNAGTVDDGPELPRYHVDRALSAYQHLRALADRLGFELYTDRNGQVMFHALGGGGREADDGATYRFGQQLISATAQRRLPDADRVVVGGESPMSAIGEHAVSWLTARSADHRGVAGDGPIATQIADPAARTRDLAERFAAGRLMVAQRRIHDVRIEILGRSGLDLGDDAEVAGVPDPLMAGAGYIRGLRHGFSTAAGFVTEVRIAVEAT